MSGENRVEPTVESGARVGRRLSTAVVLFQNAIAAHFGLNATDLRSWEILNESGSVPAGYLAERAAMDTGSMTTVIDRLERAGFVSRGKDPADRRRVIVSPVPERVAEVGRFYGELMAPMTALAASYRPDELSLILEYLDRMATILEERTSTLREARASSRQRS